ncbi:hypothetical protein VTN31DRAFT_4558 [Thermomyces dupontii]|uniref:uncharacterized protein n=1 Tax=Talaromyces thermophilus TaxID=28565 RepID=UPI0037438C66
MLSRAVLPLARTRPVSSVVRSSIISSAASSPRWYAKGRTPPYKLPDSGSDKPSPGSSASNTNAESGQPPKDHSPHQPELATSADPGKNTAPLPPGTGAGPSQSQDESKSSSQGDRPSDFETAAQGQEGGPDQQPQKPLPDLTQGIPSTIAAELEAARGKSRGPTALNLTEDPTKDDYEHAGSDRARDYESSLDRRRNRLANLTYAAFLLSGIAGTIYLGRNWESEEEAQKHPEAPSGWGLGLFYKRIKARLDSITSYYKDPAFEKLLPDEDPSQRQPYTLVLSLEDLLVHSEWTREHGWRVAKRPGVDYFLRYLNQYYELVLFTSVPSMMADQVLRKLDPYRIIRWPLFREATKYKDGEYIKDLSYLNRDLSKVILIDTVPAHAKAQPENAIILPKWKGDPKDKGLVALIPFLEYVAGMNIEDVRPVLKSFEGTDIPTEFAARERKMREKFQKQLEEERARRPRLGVGNLASLLGLKPHSAFDTDRPAADSLKEGKMLWDQIRERGQKNYELMEQEIRENGEKWLKMMAEEEEKFRQEQMKNMKGSFTSFFGVGKKDDNK